MKYKALEQYSHYEFLKKELLSDDEAVLQAGPFAAVAKLRQFKEHWNTMWQNRSFFEKYFFWLPMFGRKLAVKKADIFEEYYPEYMGKKLFGVNLNDIQNSGVMRLIIPIPKIRDNTFNLLKTAIKPTMNTWLPRNSILQNQDKW